MSAPFVGDYSARIHRAGDGEAKKRAAASSLVHDRTIDARSIARADHDPTDKEGQLGQVLSSANFIARLQTLNPNALLMPKNAHQAYYGLVKEGKFFQITGAGFPLLPEWSIFRHFEEDMPIISPNKIVSKEGVELEHFDKDTPAMERMRTSAIEIVRGWRTILGLFMVGRHISGPLAEKEFGKPNRASWAALMGHIRAREDGLTF